ncbi:MAG: Gfo/Idh/MocA family oxidoreductase [Bacteroidota bacterium]
MKYIIIGSGNISNTYIRAIGEIEGSEVLGCVSRSGKSPKDSPNLPSKTDLKAFDLDFDAVIVATPNGTHTEGIMSAAAMGKHVIVEKPLGIRMDEMEAAIAACQNAGTTLAVAYQRRTSPDNQSIKKLLDQGILGKVFGADLSAKFYRDQAYYDSGDYRGGYAIDGGGSFIQQACHNIDLYIWFFGMPEKIVSMMGRFTHDIEAEDHGAALLRYSNGMIGTFIASTSTKPGFAARLEVHTDKGSFTMLDDSISEWHFEDIPNPSNREIQYQHDGATSAVVSDVSAHKKIILDFENAVRTGTPPLVSGQSAKLTTKLILQIYEAAPKF